MKNNFYSVMKITPYSEPTYHLLTWLWISPLQEIMADKLAPGLRDNFVESCYNNFDSLLYGENGKLKKTMELFRPEHEPILVNDAHADCILFKTTDLAFIKGLLSSDPHVICYPVSKALYDNPDFFPGPEAPGTTRFPAKEGYERTKATIIIRFE